jgi:hypothetical protein
VQGRAVRPRSSPAAPRRRVRRSCGAGPLLRLARPDGRRMRPLHMRAKVRSSPLTASPHRHWRRRRTYHVRPYSVTRCPRAGRRPPVDRPYPPFPGLQDHNWHRQCRRKPSRALARARSSRAPRDAGRPTPPADQGVWRDPGGRGSSLQPVSMRSRPRSGPAAAGIGRAPAPRPAPSPARALPNRAPRPPPVGTGSCNRP